MKLNNRQKEVIEKVKNGRSIFFTGAAGTGKSFVLKDNVHQLGSPNQIP